MIEPTLQQDIKPYMDADGFVQPALGAASFNGVLYTSEYIVLLQRNGQLTADDQRQWLLAMKKITIEPGLLKRTPTYGEQEGPDDYIGYLAAAKYCYAPLAMNVYYYGLIHWGSFNNEQPGKWTLRSFLWRQPQLIAHTMYAMGESPEPLLRLIWAITIALSCRNAPTTDSDSRILSWLLIQTWDGKGWLCKWAVKIWTERLLRDYPNGMQDVARQYFQMGHPLVRYWPKV